MLAGKEYGSGSSRDWAAKGPNLLGVRAVIAESYERIHRSNLLMMGILPLQFARRERRALGLTGREAFSIAGVESGEAREVTVRADGREFTARVRLDTPREREYLRHGGILPYVLRRLLARDPTARGARRRSARPSAAVGGLGGTRAEGGLLIAGVRSCRGKIRRRARSPLRGKVRVGASAIVDHGVQGLDSSTWSKRRSPRRRGGRRRRVAALEAIG